jgi:GT2 family glycosyltransferase
MTNLNELDSIGIVLINYHSEIETVKYIKNELSHIKYNSKIVIVNNSNSDKSKELLNKNLAIEGLTDLLDTSIFIITKNQNLGYAKANNFGALFLKENFNPDYILFSNSDIVLKDNDVVDVLINKLKTLPDDVAVIGPRVVGLNGKDQSPHPKISFKRYFAWRLFPFLRGRFNALKKNSVNHEETDPKEGYCYWVSGCFMLVKSKAFFEVNMFDNHTFLYGEESILAERLKTINKFMYIFPELEIIHFEGGTTKKSEPSEKLNQFLQASTYYYYNKYMGVSKIFVNILKKIDRF